jgi:sn-glycerol 3-phosphate transport system substrate-binding protein
VPLVASTVSLMPTTIPLVGATIPLPTAGGARGFAGSSRAAAPPDIAPCPVTALDELDPADGPVEITFWHAMTAATEEALVALTDEYNASQDRVHVTLANQNGYNELTSKYFLSSESDRPEVVQMPEFMTQQMADANAVIPAGACIQAEGFDIEPFLDRALLAYQTGGIQWSMPFNASTPVLYYNRAMLEEAGLDPDDPPVSLEEFRAYADAIVESGAAPVGIAFDHGVNSGGGWFLEQWLARLGMPYADNQNGRAGRATQVVFNTPEVVEMLEFVQAMVVDGVAVDVGDNAGATDVLFKLADASEPAAMGITTSGGLGIVISVLASGQVPHLSVDDFGVGPLPGPSDTPGALVGGASLYITRDHGDAEAAASWDFIKYLTTAESQSTWAAATGYVPIREDAAELDPLAQTYADDPRFRVAFDQLTAGSDDFSSVGPVLGPLQEIREVTARMMATIFAGGDVEAALADATDQANALIADYNARN